MRNGHRGGRAKVVDRASDHVVGVVVRFNGPFDHVGAVEKLPHVAAVVAAPAAEAPAEGAPPAYPTSPKYPAPAQMQRAKGGSARFPGSAPGSASGPSSTPGSQGGISTNNKKRVAALAAGAAALAAVAGMPVNVAEGIRSNA